MSGVMWDARPRFHLLPMDTQGWGLRAAGCLGGHAVNVILGVTRGHDRTFGSAEASGGTAGTALGAERRGRVLCPPWPSLLWHYTASDPN